jgi:5'(3')-deoxyribonucleotidase
MDNLKALKKGIAVDVDETLSWTIGYWVEQMQKKFDNPENLSINNMIKKYRYTQNVPYWQSAEALKWIDEKIHSNELQEILPLIKGSNVYLNRIAKIIPITTYITVRPEIIRSGTQKWLDKHNFPKAPIICKPLNVEHKDGNKWKAKVLEKLYPKVLGMIDDNAKLLECLDNNYKGIIYLYDHSVVDSELNVIPCKNWPDVFEEVKKHFGK